MPSDDLGPALVGAAIGAVIAAGLIGLIKYFSDQNNPPKKRCWYFKKLINRNSTYCPYCYQNQ